MTVNYKRSNNYNYNFHGRFSDYDNYDENENNHEYVEMFVNDR